MLLHMDGFDSYANAIDLTQEYISYNCEFSINSGRYGGGCLNFNSNTNYLSWAANTSHLTDIYTGFAINILSDCGNSVIAQFLSINGTEIQITYNTTTNHWCINYSNNNTLIKSIYYPITKNSWHWIELYYNTNGTLTTEIWIDNIPVITCNNITSITNNNQLTTIQLGSSKNSCSYNILFDDWYILDSSGIYNNARLGDSRISTLVPTGDAEPNDGYSSTPGPNYLMVNEPQWNTSNLVTLQPGNGNAQLYDMSKLIGNITLVHAVKALAVMNKENSGIMLVNTVVNSGTVKVLNTSMPVTTTVNHIYGIFETDPNTSTPWSNVTINNAQFGITVL